MPAKELSPIEIYRALPGTNCKECGEANCMAFAAKLVNREATLSECTPLLKPEYKEAYDKLWEKYPLDKGDTHHTRDDLAVSLEEVKENFRRFDLLSEQIVFIKGYFEDSLKTAEIDRLALLRLDGDMYGSTMTVLEQLYDKLEVGGYLILDDWLLKGAREALLDFRQKAEINEEMYQDYSGVFWRKNRSL